MNLVQLLLRAMLTNNSVNSVSQKTGISSQLVKKLIVAAIPLLIKYMTKNASTGNGAQSLLSALTQHTSNRSMAQQIDEVDEADGDKIISHILGNDKKAVVKELAAETGASAEQVTRGLASIAPALLSGLSAATNSAHQSQAQSSALDLSSLLGMFAGSQQQAAQPTDLLSLFLGGNTQQQTQQAKPQSGLAQLFGLAQPQQQVQQQTQAADPMTSLLTSLLTGGTQQAKPQQTQQAKPQQSATVIPLTGNTAAATNTANFDGSALLNILTALMK